MTRLIRTPVLLSTVLPWANAALLMSVVLLASACSTDRSDPSKRSRSPSEGSQSTPDAAAPAPPNAAASAPLSSAGGSSAGNVSAPVSTAAVPVAPASRGPMKPRVEPEVCADCHPDQVEGYLKTGMARSLYRPKSRPPIEDFAKATVEHAPFVYRAYIDDQGRWWQEETVPGADYKRAVEVQYVIGSGNHTRSYIGRVEGELVELPLTWYSSRKIWDMSPGYEVPGGNQRFERPIKPECLFCHNGLTPTIPETVAGYKEPLVEGIGCDRCHGAAHEHVAQRQAGKGPPAGQPDPTILNPKRLDATGQLRVCQQCHLQGEVRVLVAGQRWDNYDPREPLPEFMSVFEYAETGGADFSIASHGERLALSACFKKSAGKLACTTCHDPHRPQSDEAAKSACVQCHQPGHTKGCSEPKHAEKRCADCHLRRAGTSDIPHVTFTDHWIRTRPQAPVGERPFSLKLVDRLADARQSDSPAGPLHREGIAHAKLWRLHGKSSHLPEGLKRLERGLKRDPTDYRAWREVARIQTALGNLQGALGALLQVELLQPEGVLFRADLADAHQAIGELDKAEAALRAAVAQAPGSRVSWGNLGNVLQRQQKFIEAELAYAQADALAPHLALTAINRGYNAMAQKKPARARHWFAEAIKRDAAHPRGYFAMGTLAMESKDWKAADGWFDKALKMEPKYVDALWLKGRVAREAGDTAGARRLFEKMLEIAPTAVNGYLDLAALEAAAGNEAARRQVLLKGLMQMPEHPALTQALQAKME